jgi:hypothetical protein
LLAADFGAIALISIDGIRSGFGPSSGSLPRGAGLVPLAVVPDDGLTAGSPVPSDAGELAGKPTLALFEAPESTGGSSGKPLEDVPAVEAGIEPTPAPVPGAPTGVKASKPRGSFAAAAGCGIAVSGDVGSDETGGSETGAGCATAPAASG